MDDTQWQQLSQAEKKVQLYLQQKELLQGFLSRGAITRAQYNKSFGDLTLKMTLPRCSWCNTKNPLYVSYHDSEWGVPCHDDHTLYELFILESFQAGLSWETVLNKREHFRTVYDNFNIDKVCDYDEEKISRLVEDKGIIRNRLKIEASIKNSRIFREIQSEYGSFDKYIRSFTDGNVIFESDPLVTTSPLSDTISNDLKKRGAAFVGSTIIYAYLQAIGVINAHSKDCFCYRRK